MFMSSNVQKIIRSEIAISLTEIEMDDSEIRNNPQKLLAFCGSLKSKFNFVQNGRLCFSTVGNFFVQTA